MHLYVHVPFCARRCSYCDFAIAVRKEVPSRAFADALLAEFRMWEESGRIPQETIETLYFGGGTPSHLDPDELTRIIHSLVGVDPVYGLRELTIEANPDDVSPERARKWASEGVNRISLGIQSFDPAVLSWMHRVHTTEQSLEAVRVLRDAGITNISLDLIYALPPELARDWSRDLDAALALEPEHLSLYGLTVEPHTPLYKWVASRKSAIPDEGRYAEEFLLAHERLTAAGYEHYEVSNYGRPGRRAIHNSAYWQRRPFLGLGPSAHSGIGNERWWNTREYAEWLAQIERGSGVLAGREMLDAEQIRLEDLYLGLRTNEGLAEDRLPPGTAEQWVGAGWATVEMGKVVLTAEGWLRLDALVGQVA